MYGYLENETLHRAPNPMVIGENRVWNPANEMYETAGYKRVIFTDPPETEPGYHAEDWWKETAKQIRQQWEIVEDPDDVDPAEAWEYIFGGEGE